VKQQRLSWFKMWTDGVIDDELDPFSFGIFVKLISLSAHSGAPGIVQVAHNIGWPHKELAQLVHTTVRQLRHALAEIEASGKIATDANGCISILKWSKYQSDYCRVLKQRNGQLDTQNDTPNDTPPLCIQNTDNRIQSTEPPLVPPEGGAANAAKAIDGTFIAALQAEHPTLNVPLEHATFVDYNKAKGRRPKDNRAAFRNWLRNAVKFQQRDNGGSRPRAGPPPPENDHGAALLAKYGSRT